MQKIITRNLKNIKRHLTGEEKIITLGFKIITLSFLGFSFGLFASNSVFAETMKNKVNIKPSMTLDIPVSSINLNLDPATNAFASEDVNITVGTNNKTGYWITMSSSTGESDLVNIDDNTKTIPTIATAGSYTSLDFPINQWGYKIDSGNYTPFVSGATIKSSSATANGETFKLNIASKIDYLQPSGTYNIALNIKMLPNMTTNYIQNLDSTLCTEDPMVVIDNRDEQPYVVQRLKDGNCWLLENLRLDISDPTVQANLTSATTNADNTTLSYLKNGGGSSPYPANGVIAKTASGGSWDNDYANPYIATEYKNTTQPASGSSPAGKIGIYYNYCAASAGSYCYTGGAGTGNASQDICPAGWRMPTGGASGEYQALYTAYSSNVANFQAALSTPLSGGFGDGSTAYDQGSYGNFWSSTIRGDGNYMYRLGVSRSTVGPQSNYYRFLGFSVRCLLKES